MNIEVIATIVGVCIAIVIISGLITILGAFARFVWIVYMVITSPIRFIARLF